MARTPDYKARVLAQQTVWAAGAYDALSARLIAEAGFDAVMSSGFGVSASFLGQPDAELYTMTENLSVNRNIVNSVNIPVISDIDTGYGNAINVMRTVREFEGAGVSAVILEDQVSPKRCPICVGGVEVVSLEEGVSKIAAAVDARRDPNMVIIARTDAATPDEAIRRAKAYVAAGADVIQPISKCFTSYDGLKELREACGVPLSLQILGWLEKDLTPQQISSVAGMATFALVPLMTVAHALRENLRHLQATKSARGLPRPVTDHNDFIKFIGFGEVEELQKKYLKAS
jgi:methylisocitrate lyase